MRIHFTSDDRAKGVAKSLKRELAAIGHVISLKQAQHATAKAYGYPDWQVFTQVLGTLPPSHDDELCDDDTRSARFKQQVAAIITLGVSHDEAKRIVTQLRPTAGGRSLKAITWAPFTQKRELGRLDYGDTPLETGVMALTEHVAFFVFPSTEGDLCPVFEEIWLNKDRMPTGIGWWPAAPAIPGDDPTYETEALAMKAAEKTIRQLNALDRKLLSEDETRAIKTPKGDTVTKAMNYGDGLIYYHEDRYVRGFRLSPERLKEMPAELRVNPDENGYGWYQDIDFSLVVATGIPRFFTEAEINNSYWHIKETFPGLFAIMSGIDSKTPSNIFKARRNLGRNDAFKIVGVGRPNEDDLVEVRAKPDYLDQCRRFIDVKDDEVFTFLVPASDLDSHDFTVGTEYEMVVPKDAIEEAENESEPRPAGLPSP